MPPYSPARLGRTPPAMTRRDWFHAVVRAVRAGLPRRLAAFSPTVGTSLLKIAYDNPRVHFEVGPDSTRGHLELALHFEDGPASTIAYLRWFDREIVALKHDLGTNLELERWTASWGRIYELHPLPLFDARTAAETGARLAVLIATLQPMVESAGVSADRR